MESFKTALYEYVEKDFKIVLNKYCNEMANQIFEKSKDKVLTEKEIITIMNTVLNEHAVHVHVLGGKKKEKEEKEELFCVELLAMGENKGKPCGKKCCAKSESLCSVHYNKKLKREENVNEREKKGDKKVKKSKK